MIRAQMRHTCKKTAAIRAYSSKYSAAISAHKMQFVSIKLPTTISARKGVVALTLEKTDFTTTDGEIPCFGDRVNNIRLAGAAHNHIINI